MITNRVLVVRSLSLTCLFSTRGNTALRLDLRSSVAQVADSCVVSLLLDTLYFGTKYSVSTLHSLCSGLYNPSCYKHQASGLSTWPCILR